MNPTLPVLLLCAFALCGCASTGAGARTWWNPTTWFSGSEGRGTAKAEEKVHQAEGALLKEAQKTAHETQLALASAPASRPVEVARESNDATVGALDQLAGPLTIAESQKLRAAVAGLLSEVATTRAAAEAERKLRREELADASNTIASLRDDLAAAQAKLTEAFERENRLANQYRNARFALFGAAALAAIGFLGMTYLKFAYGGIPQAIGRGLSELRLRNPQAGELATSVFDSYLNRQEQRRIVTNT